jgi:hypothetical protein
MTWVQMMRNSRTEDAERLMEKRRGLKKVEF